ncbi:hypothetical protein [Helicobacter sp. MIT 05-5294]|uniref:hypothetical protein n=1 Tax=Helicobacter sp. MIT 05-5294 TaxID=1548150 RepID=UPI00051FEB73|nr:hypothetical protein [Helicobacter sp. MIT 05-5294]TLD85628.1 hypothetical protein LS69_008615 [Helicobacter sp. MIT 05-5294]
MRDYPFVIARKPLGFLGNLRLKSRPTGFYFIRKPTMESQNSHSITILAKAQCAIHRQEKAILIFSKASFRKIFPYCLFAFISLWLLGFRIIVLRKNL